MPRFSRRSLDNLESCHQDLQIIFNYVIKERDCTIIHGHRTKDEQFELFKKGRKKMGDQWRIVQPAKVVTYLDGYEAMSNHNFSPSMAVDVVPYYGVKPHIRWDDIEGMRMFGNYVLGVIDTLRRYGAIENDITWGGEWRSFKDYPHWELKQ